MCSFIHLFCIGNPNNPQISPCIKGRGCSDWDSRVAPPRCADPGARCVALRRADGQGRAKTAGAGGCPTQWDLGTLGCPHRHIGVSATPPLRWMFPPCRAAPTRQQHTDPRIPHTPVPPSSPHLHAHTPEYPQGTPARTHPRGVPTEPHTPGHRPPHGVQHSGTDHDRDPARRGGGGWRGGGTFKGALHAGGSGGIPRRRLQPPLSPVPGSEEAPGYFKAMFSPPPRRPPRAARARAGARPAMG